MKKSIYIKMMAGAALASMLLVTNSSSLYAQRRENPRPEKRYEESRDSRKESKYNSRRHEEVKYHHRDGDHDRGRHKGHDSKYNSHKKYKHHHGYYESNGHYHDHYGHSHARVQHYCYQHPRYGRVVSRFAAPPVLIRYTHGSYYYSDGYYYRYQPRIGYVVVEAPRKVCFHEIPVDCNRVVYNGSDYYVHGDLCFMKDGKGFRIVARPEGVHFSIDF